MRTMRAGALTKLLVVEQDTAVAGDQQADGYEPEDWVFRANMWCSVKPANGRELVHAAAVGYENPVAIFMRWDSRLADINPTDWRIRHERRGRTTVVYNIISAVNVDEADVELRLLCSSGTRVPTA